jgi:hypothetical protein
VKNIVQYLYGEEFAKQVSKMDDLNLAVQNAMNFKYCMMFKNNLEKTIQELERKENAKKII